MIAKVGTMIRFGRRGTSVSILIFLSLLLFYLYNVPSLRSSFMNPSTGEPWDAANATLGFGGVFVVSKPESPRRPYLEQAAAVTGLQLTIPRQREWTEEDLNIFRAPDSIVGTGSVKAWLSHHLVLHAFLNSGLETALIMEDDVDWDIHLRTAQIPLAQQASRHLAGPSKFSTSQYPWGDPKTWDLLYLGHCGDYWGDVEEGTGVGYVHPDELARTPHVLYRDQTVLSRMDLHPFTSSLLTALGIPGKTRVLHRSKHPLCTFGYAVTRESAQKILTSIAPPKETPGRGIKAFDVAIMAACSDGYEMRCWSLNPELFHHMEGKSLIEIEETEEREQIIRPPVDATGALQVEWRKETSNIQCGFWSGEFYYEDDNQRLEFLKKEVGKKGRCLKAGRERKGWFG